MKDMDVGYCYASRCIVAKYCIIVIIIDKCPICYDIKSPCVAISPTRKLTCDIRDKLFNRVHIFQNCFTINSLLINLTNFGFGALLRLRL